jgi:hypothetical protein
MKQKPIHMKQKRILILAVLSEWLLIAMTVTAAFSLESSFPEPLQAYLAEDAKRDYTSWGWALTGIAIANFVLNFVSSIGLLFLRSWARIIYTVTLLLSSILWLFLDGPTIHSSIGGFFGDLSLIAAGFLICLIWFSGLAPCFNKHENP